MKNPSLLAVLLIMLLTNPVQCQVGLQERFQLVKTQIDAHEYHEALENMNIVIAGSEPTGRMFLVRGWIFMMLNDQRSSVEDLKMAVKLGAIRDNSKVKYFISKEFLANEVAREYMDDTLKAENGFKPKFSRKDSLRGGQRSERSCYDVYFYDLKVNVKPESKEISGSNAICFKVIEDTRRIQFDLFPELTIQKMVWHNRELQLNREYNAVFVEFPELLRAGERDTVLITYSGKPHEATNPPWNGGFVWKKKRGKHWVGVACEHLGASCWWPNKDFLADKPDSMRITVVTPPEYQGISNGNLRSVTKAKEGWRYEWFVTYPITNYLVTLYVGNFVNLHETMANSSGEISLDFYVLPHHKRKAEVYYSQTRKIMEVYGKLYGDYPFPRDGGAWVEAPFAGMEHQGAIAIGDEYGKKFRRIYDKCDFDYLLVHETAHEWWGNAVGMSEMADAWISEGFTTYSEFLFMEQVYGYEKYMNVALSNMSQILNIWPVVGTRDVNDNTFLGGDIYNKGAVMLHNLRCLLDNDSLFFGLVKGFYHQYIYHCASTMDFINFANQYLGRDFTPFFQKFLFDREPPVLTYRYLRNGDHVVLSYKWSNVGNGFEMPFLVFTGDSISTRLTATTKYQSTVLPHSKTFRIANFLDYPKSIPRNSLTYFQTSIDTLPPYVALYTNGNARLVSFMTDYTPVDDSSRRSGYGTDTLNGGFNIFYENGKPEVCGVFIDGKPAGDWAFYSPSGNIAAKGSYVNGTFDEKRWKYYNKDGKVAAPDSVYTFVNTQPHFFDGEEAMFVYIRNRLNLASMATGNIPSGTVVVSFVVEPNGMLSDFKVERSISPEVGQEVLKVMAGMPPWAPGYLDGNPVRVKMFIPVRIN